MYYDHHWHFLLEDIDKAVEGIRAVDDECFQRNMLGEPFTEEKEDTVTLCGRLGNVLKKQNHMYISARTTYEKLNVDLTEYGLQPVSEEDSAAVLGVWL